jgi:hypothetical protein
MIEIAVTTSAAWGSLVAAQTLNDSRVIATGRPEASLYAALAS